MVEKKRKKSEGSKSNITEQELRKAVKVYKLDLSNHKPKLTNEDLPLIASFLKKNPLITHLKLSNNNITDISSLDGVNDIMWMLLDHNDITNITPLLGMNQLEAVDLSHNPNLSDIDEGLKNKVKASYSCIVLEETKVLGNLKKELYIQVKENIKNSKKQMLTSVSPRDIGDTQYSDLKKQNWHATSSWTDKIFKERWMELKGIVKVPGNIQPDINKEVIPVVYTALGLLEMRMNIGKFLKYEDIKTNGTKKKGKAKGELILKYTKGKGGDTGQNPTQFGK